MAEKGLALTLIVHEPRVPVAACVADETEISLARPDRLSNGLTLFPGLAAERVLPKNQK